MYDPQMHGTIEEPDLRGIDPNRSALLLLEQGRSAWVFAPGRTPEQLVQTARQQFEVLDPSQASLLSFTAQSTEPEMVFSSVQRAQRGTGTRRPSVAGMFYPGEADELRRMVDGMLHASQRRAEAWPAAMVPHAGLIYSGQLAAAVLNRIEIPELVIVIGPKHTRLGVEWAVAPRDEWSIPGATVSSDPALARELVASIPGPFLEKGCSESFCKRLIEKQ